MTLLTWIGDGLWNAVQMFWEVWWALALGFLLSAIVQAWVPRARIEKAFGGTGVREAALATGLGAVSSSCSYAAVAIAKSMFEKGASFASAMAFQFASTNLVFELGIVMWVLLGWQFTLAEFAGGLILIALMWVAVRLFVTRRLEQDARRHAQNADTGHQHQSLQSRKLLSLDAWSDVAHNFRGDWEMVWKEIGVGFLIAGYIALLPQDVFNTLFTGRTDVLIGPLIAALSFVCSIGNVPLAAVLWAGGISFAGVISFIYADLIVIPIVLIYRKYYGGRLTAIIVAIMLASMIVAALAVDGLFSALGIVPTHRPSLDSVTNRGIGWNYTTWLNILFAVVAAGLFALTVRRGAKDPVCGMTVDRNTPYRSIVDGRTVYFCSAHCKATFDARAVGATDAPPPDDRVATHAHPR
jgi:uncharacterized protein